MIGQKKVSRRNFLGYAVTAVVCGVVGGVGGYYGGILSAPTVTAPFKMANVLAACPPFGPSMIVFEIPREQGFYAENGLIVETSYGSPSVAAQALLSGEIHFAGGVDSLRLAMKGADLKMVFCVLDKPPFWLISQPQYQSLEDLKGKNIATDGRATTPDILCKELIIKPAGYKEEDFVWTYVTGHADKHAALKKGSVDAVFLPIPFIYILEQEGFTVLARSTDYVKSWPMISVCVRGDMIRERPELIEGYCRALIKAMEWYRAEENLAAAVKWQMDHFQMEEELATTFVKGHPSFWTQRGEIDMDGLQFYVDYARGVMEIQEEIPAESLVDLSFLKRLGVM